MIVPIWAATLYASAIPIAVILLMQIRTRSFMDANNGIMGLLYSLITAAVFQAFLKWLIGGLRPHFLTICKPDLSLAKTVVGGDGFGNLYYTSEVCTGNTRDVEDSLESFPSGHSTAAFAGFVYLSLYLNGKLKVFADHVRVSSFFLAPSHPCQMRRGNANRLFLTALPNVEIDCSLRPYPNCNADCRVIDNRRVPQLVRCVGWRPFGDYDGFFLVSDDVRLVMGLDD